jgi:hypothetical protein
MSLLPVFDALAEARIQEAMREGAFDDLPGAGRPLVLDDDRLVPAELRAAYRVLRNAGYAPAEVEARRERASLAALLARLDDGTARRRALAKLALLDAVLYAGRSRVRGDRSYEARLAACFGAR